jgi:hypothetical protein
MARLTYKGTGRACEEKLRDSKGVPSRCKEDASRGSKYCLRHKHSRNKK